MIILLQTRQLRLGAWELVSDSKWQSSQPPSFKSSGSSTLGQWE